MTEVTPVLADMESAAEILGVPLRRLRDWVQKGTAPESRVIGRRRYFRRSDVEAWVEAKFAGDAR